MYKRVSKTGALKWSIYYSPLQYTTWLVAMSTLSVHTLGYVLATRGSGKEPDLLTGIHGLFMQGSPIEPLSVSARVAFWFLFITGRLLWASHSATLSSLLAVKIDKPPFLSLSGMLRDTNYNVMFLQGDGELEQFKVYSFRLS